MLYSFKTYNGQLFYEHLLDWVENRVQKSWRKIFQSLTKQHFPLFIQKTSSGEMVWFSKNCGKFWVSWENRFVKHWGLSWPGFSSGSYQMLYISNFLVACLNRILNSVSIISAFSDVYGRYYCSVGWIKLKLLLRLLNLVKIVCAMYT